jgi:hypothetical protein
LEALMPDHPLQLTPDRIASLSALRVAAKFIPDAAMLYSGAPSESVRAECEARVNELIDRLLGELASNPRKETALAIFRSALPQFETADSEERDRVCSYLEQIMGILGIESSDGLLNTWRYGFDSQE